MKTVLVRLKKAQNNACKKNVDWNFTFTTNEYTKEICGWKYQISKYLKCCNRLISRTRSWCTCLIELSKVFNWHNLDTIQFSVSIHERNIEILATEMFKISKNLAPPQMHEIFKLKDQPQHNLRHSSLFSRPLVKSVYTFSL